MNKIKCFESFLNENYLINYLTLEETEKIKIIAEAIENLENDENVDEGFKDVIIGGLLSLLVSGGVLQAQPTSDWQSVSKKTEVIDKKTKKIDSEIKRTFNIGDKFTKAQADSVINSMIKRGWSLKSSEIDTIWNEVKTQAPDTALQAISVVFADDAYFASGKFDISSDMKARIDSSLQNIVDAGGVMIKIDITSSTDKQGLSKSLQEKLKSLGYTPDNNGLSKARSAELEKYLKDKGIDSSVIYVENLSEKGENEIDQSARYVKIDFIYLMSIAKESSEEAKKVSEIKYMVNLTKTFVVDSKPSKPSGSKTHVKVGKVKDFPNKGSVKCPKFGG